MFGMFELSTTINMQGKPNQDEWKQFYLTLFSWKKK